jgi:hypothetical protein
MISSGSGLNWTLSVSQPTLSGVTVTTGPVQSNQNGAFFAGGVTIAKYNADLGWGQFANGGNGPDDFTLEFNYAALVSRPSQHINFGIKQPDASKGALLSNYVQNFNTVWWTKDSYFGTGTGTLDQFTTLTNGGPAMMVTNLSQAKNNVLIANTTINGGTGAPTAALLRYLSQGGGNLGTINFSLTGGVMTVTSVTTVTLAVGQFVSCQSCSVPIQITSFGTGSGGTGTYNVSNSTDTISGTGAAVYLYPGQINNLDWEQNYLDATGSLANYVEDKGNVPVVSKTISGNINMLNGNVCNPSPGTC